VSAASVLTAFGSPPRHAPSRDLQGLRPRSQHRRPPSHVPCQSRRPGSRRLHAGHHLASNRDTRQAYRERTARPPGFRCQPRLCSRRLNSARPPGLPRRTLLERLPGPHLTRSSAPFSLSLTTTVFSQRSTGRFGASPPKGDAGGPQSLHLQHSTAYTKIASTSILLQRS
jgi:hypothetical protein